MEEDWKMNKRIRLNAGVHLVELEQTVGVLAGLEEVGFLVGIVDLAAALGAFAVHQDNFVIYKAF